MVRTAFLRIRLESQCRAGHTPFQAQTPEGVYSRILREDIVRARLWCLCPFFLIAVFLFHPGIRIARVR